MFREGLVSSLTLKRGKGCLLHGADRAVELHFTAEGRLVVRPIGEVSGDIIRFVRWGRPHEFRRTFLSGRKRVKIEAVSLRNGISPL